MNVTLIGYRGTGKSTVARALAARLDWDWLDTDDLIEQQTGKTIKAIFAEDGEPRFRDLESAVIADVAGRQRIVLALGGGAVLREDNRRAIAASHVVWLQADPPTIHARMNADTGTAQRRPDLTAAGGLQEITQLLADREPVYRACADYEVSTAGKTPEQLAEEIVCLLGDEVAD